MGWGEVFKVGQEWLVGKLPGWLLKRFYPLSQMAEEINIDIRSFGESFCIDLNNQQVTIWFRIINMSPLDIKLDRLLWEISFQQPFIDNTVHKKEKIKSKKIKDIIGKHSLPEKHTTQIRNKKMAKEKLRATFHLTAYFQTAIGEVEKTTHIEGIKPEINA